MASVTSAAQQAGEGDLLGIVKLGAEHLNRSEEDRAEVLAEVEAPRADLH